MYTIDGFTKIFWAYSLRIIIYVYTKFLLPVIEALPKKKALEDHNRAKTACFLSLRLGQKRWTMITESDVFWIHKAKIKDENKKS